MAIATVDSNGLVTAVADGTATVTVAQAAADIEISSPSLNVTAGETIQLSATGFQG